jgi:hypothetical protein
MFNAEGVNASIEGNLSESQVVKLTQNYEVDLKLLAWHDPAKSYFV